MRTEGRSEEGRQTCMYIHSGTRCIGEKTVQYWPKIDAVPGTCECVFLIYDINLQPRNKKEEEKRSKKK